MKLLTIASILGAIESFAVLVNSAGDSTPGCVDICWNNSKFVSSCADDTRCLCEEAEFQNAVYQCLYSQCQTSQFGLALHHAIAKCADYDVDVTPTLPQILGHNHLHNHENTHSNYASGSAGASAVQSVRRRHATTSASVFPCPTRSAAYGSMQTTSTWATPSSLSAVAYATILPDGTLLTTSTMTSSQTAYQL